jgi:dTDP-4-amino-4,6-dideoxygalactose transaminase
MDRTTEAQPQASSPSKSLNGSAPLIRDTFLPFALPLIGDEEIEGVLTCLRSGWLTTGQKVKQFEQEFAAAFGVKHAIAVNSCTAALHLALEAVGVGPDDEVITTPMTFTATAAVIEHLGGKPVLVDVEPGTLNIDPTKIEAAITPRTKALLPVHFTGQAADMDPILEIAKRHRLPVIEDAAHAIPTKYKGRMIGNVGDITCFSFYATKNLTTGEGGMITTNDDAKAERMRLMALHGMSKDAWKRYTQAGAWHYEILAPGFKYNLTDIAAAIGIPQLHHMDRYHARRLEIARRYSAAFASLPALETPTVRDDVEHGWHLYVLQVRPERLDIDRDQFIREIVAANIGVSVHFIPLHLHPYWRDRYGWKADDFPNAYRAYQRILSLPLYAKMSDQDIDDVIHAVTRVAQAHTR